MNWFEGVKLHRLRTGCTKVSWYFTFLASYFALTIVPTPIAPPRSTALQAIAQDSIHGPPSSSSSVWGAIRNKIWRESGLGAGCIETAWVWVVLVWSRLDVEGFCGSFSHLIFSGSGCRFVSRSYDAPAITKQQTQSRIPPNKWWCSVEMVEEGGGWMGEKLEKMGGGKSWRLRNSIQIPWLGRKLPEGGSNWLYAAVNGEEIGAPAKPLALQPQIVLFPCL